MRIVALLGLPVPADLQPDVNATPVRSRGWRPSRIAWVMAQTEREAEI
jgi:hypothetical protein